MSHCDCCCCRDRDDDDSPPTPWNPDDHTPFENRMMEVFVASMTDLINRPMLGDGWGK